MSAEPLSQQQQQQQAMEVFDFEGVDFVRLRSGCAYLHAADDGRSVRLDRRRESHHAVWAVTPLVYSEGSIPCVLLRGAYGRYLGAADASPRGSLCPSPCLAAKQRDYDWQEVPAIMWRAVATRRQGAFRLQDATGRYLRRCLLSGLYVSDGGSLCTATKWVVERVPRAGRPDPPIPPPESLFARVCPLLSYHCTSERKIQWRVVNGPFSNFEWDSTRALDSTLYRGRDAVDLKRWLVNQVPRYAEHPEMRDVGNYTLCVRAGRNGQLSPLVVNQLPRSREPLDIVLVWRNTAVDNELIYLDVNAVAGAAAVAEQVL